MKAAVFSLLVLIVAGAVSAKGAPDALTDVRIAFETTADGALFVRELIVIKAPKANGQNTETMTIPLPVGAVNTALSEEHGIEGLTLTKNAITVSTPIPATLK